ncbi:MAG TPA: DUF2933 domain-containing protein [Terriglobia bacterium]|nr:DUF2933 domain-containing protein [Terriglobia bacterium]
MNPHEQHRTNAVYWGGFLVFLSISVVFLWTEHRAHLLGALPYALVLICLLMHFLMHRGHRHDYAAGTPAFIPRFGRHSHPEGQHGSARA